MFLFVALIIVLNITSSLQYIQPEGKVDQTVLPAKPKQVDPDPKHVDDKSHEVPHFKIETGPSTESKGGHNVVTTEATKSTTKPAKEILKFVHETNENVLEPGALLRGFYVLVGITLLLVIYLGYRMYRTGKGSKPPAMVRKYGILTRRGDVEMLPLPLSEDEDDDTVFELNDHVNR